jgi:death-on-curing protein
MPSRVPLYPVPRAATLGEAYEMAAQQLLADIIGFHIVTVQIDGGTLGIRDHNGLSSAVFRPLAIYADAPAYNSGLEQAAALLQSLVLNHPFVDGNKRTAFLACLYFLERCDYWNDAGLLSQHEAQALETLILNIAQGRCREFPIILAQLRRILSPSRKIASSAQRA